MIKGRRAERFRTVITCVAVERSRSIVVSTGHPQVRSFSVDTFASGPTPSITRYACSFAYAFIVNVRVLLTQTLADPCGVRATPNPVADHVPVYVTEAVAKPLLTGCFASV